MNFSFIRGAILGGLASGMVALAGWMPLSRTTFTSIMAGVGAASSQIEWALHATRRRRNKRRQLGEFLNFADEMRVHSALPDAEIIKKYEEATK